MTLADTAACAAYATKLLHRHVTADNIRHWAMRHPSALPKRGRHGRTTLYALEDIHAYATTHQQRLQHPPPV